MRTFQGFWIRAIATVAVVVIGVVTLFAVSNNEGSARTSLADSRVTALSSSRDSVIYASVDAPLAGFYRSTDGGRTWQMVSRTLDQQVNALVVNPSDRRPSGPAPRAAPLRWSVTAYSSRTTEVKLDADSAFLPASPEGRIPSVLALAADPRDAGTLYVGTDGQGLYKLTDLGTTMTSLGSDFYQARVEQIVATALDPQKIFAVTSNGVFESQNGGDNWSRMDSLPEKAVALAVAPSNNRIIYAGTASMGAYRSDDGGKTWTSIGNGLGLVPGDGFGQGYRSGRSEPQSRLRDAELHFRLQRRSRGTLGSLREQQWGTVLDADQGRRGGGAGKRRRDRPRG